MDRINSQAVRLVIFKTDCKSTELPSVSDALRAAVTSLRDTNCETGITEVTHTLSKAEQRKLDVILMAGMPLCVQK
jgi:hypothetical protein